MDRKSKIEKSVSNSILGSFTYLLIILAVGAYFASNILFPQEATPENVKQGKYYVFTGVRAENKFADQKTGYIYITLINEKKEVMDVCVDSEKKAKEVMKASKEKPFKFRGQSYMQDSEYRKTMSNLYNEKDITYLHPFGLLDYRVGWEPVDFIFPVVIIASFFANLFPIFRSRKLKKKAIEFLDNNPFYNERQATKQIDKYVDIINDYIIIMTFTPAIINIRESSEIVLTRHRSYFVTTHFTLSLLDKEGKKRTYNVPKLQKEKAQELLDYINNFDKTVVSDI